MMRPLDTFDAVKQLVDHFYAHVRKNGLIGPIFDRVIEGRWPEHLEKMYRFWQTILLGEHTYRGFPFRPHANLPVSQEHFERWLSLFSQTLDTEFEGDNVVVAKRQATQMARMFHMKIEQIKAYNLT